jgi:hypothetical protein
MTLSETEIRAAAAELKAILEDTLRLLEPEKTKRS